MIKKLTCKSKKTPILLTAIFVISKSIIAAGDTVFAVTTAKTSQLTEKVLQKEPLILAFWHDFGYNCYSRPPPERQFQLFRKFTGSNCQQLVLRHYLKREQSDDNA